MLSIYPACFFEEENHYSVIFPDFNYLSTCGDLVLRQEKGLIK